MADEQLEKKKDVQQLRKSHNISAVAVAMKFHKISSISLGKMQKYHVVTCNP